MRIYTRRCLSAGLCCCRTRSWRRSGAPRLCGTTTPRGGASTRKSSCNPPRAISSGEEFFTDGRPSYLRYVFQWPIWTYRIVRTHSSALSRWLFQNTLDRTHGEPRTLSLQPLSNTNGVDAAAVGFSVPFFLPRAEKKRKREGPAALENNRSVFPRRLLG